MSEFHMPKCHGKQGSSPLSPVIDTGAIVYVSGQVASVPAGEEMPAGIEGQTRLVLQKILKLLGEVGLGLENVAKVTVFLKDIAHVAAMNSVYREFFTEPFPSRSAIGAQLAKPAFLVEIEATAVRTAARG
jgi:2-iminobutanoate/2-iminopropanoate deaminase